MVARSQMVATICRHAASCARSDMGPWPGRVRGLEVDHVDVVAVQVNESEPAEVMTGNAGEGEAGTLRPKRR